jgi:hypothetical protein
MARTPRYFWADYSDAELLQLRLCDLGLKLEGSVLAERVERLGEELERKRLRFRPHVWLSSEWFSPDGVPGVAAPFYLAHPRLVRLERAQMLHAEGGTETTCMRLLRHETGHAIDTAYRLHLRKRWRDAFGLWSTPYEREYSPKPYSKRYVMHLDLWYAQSHPAEDWAETFAVWLRPRSDWRKRYARWPALKKLEAVDALMSDVAEKAQPVRCREKTERLALLKTTLGEHYAAKKRRYGLDAPEAFDPLLRRLFPDSGDGPAATGGAEEADGAPRAGTPAARFLRRHRAELRRAVSTWTGQLRYTIDQVLLDMIDRAEELDLRLLRDEREALADATVVLTVQTMNHLHDGSLKLAR